MFAKGKYLECQFNNLDIFWKRQEPHEAKTEDYNSNDNSNWTSYSALPIKTVMIIIM